jgi:hypothetical protein
VVNMVTTSPAAALAALQGTLSLAFPVGTPPQPGTSAALVVWSIVGVGSEAAPPPAAPSALTLAAVGPGVPHGNVSEYLEASVPPRPTSPN